MTVTRILRQADWDWGLEPAVGSVVLAAHLKGLDGLGVLDRDWESICRSRPDAIAVHAAGDGVWLFEAAQCHAFVAAPSVLDHLIAGVSTHGQAAVTLEACVAPQMMAALAFFGPHYGLSIRLDCDVTLVTAARGSGLGSAQPLSALQRADCIVEADLWERLRRRSMDYLVPESETSRGHAGDGTRAFPLSPREGTL